MRFWITKNSEVPIHEQLVRQVMLAILSEDLPAGRKLPSIRALARRYGIHSNTVSAAYHDLVNRGWLEMRAGSGIFVTPVIRQPDAAVDQQAAGLDTLLTELLRTARARGHSPDAVLRRLEELLMRRNVTSVAVVESDPGMREILQTELQEQLEVPVDAFAPEQLDLAIARSRLVVALPTRAAAIRERLPRGVPFFPLRLRSVMESLQAQTRPAPDTIVSIVSRSIDFRNWARAMLIAVGLDPDCLCEVDTSLDDWRQRARAGALVIADVVAAQRLPDARLAKVFRVVADSCLSELREFCASPVAVAKVPQA